MKKSNFIGKTLEEAKEKALVELGCSEDEIFCKEINSTGGLFKAKKTEIEVITKQDIIEAAKNFLINITKLMGLNINFEVKERDKITTLTIFCDNNNILIGKQGRTVNALSLILKQYLFNELGFYYNLILDVGEYKQKNEKRLERLAKSLARDVVRSQMELKLDPMNSYERRIIHTVLSENNKVTTESEGIEPNRYVVIKPKKD